MERYLTSTELLARQRRNSRIATHASNVMACAGLLLAATAAAGWLLTW